MWIPIGKVLGKFQQPESHKRGVLLLLRNKNVYKALANQADKKIDKIIKHKKGEQLNVFLHLAQIASLPALVSGFMLSRALHQMRVCSLNA